MSRLPNGKPIMKMVTLRNGSQELHSLALAVYVTLRGLHRVHPLAFQEAVRTARNPAYLIPSRSLSDELHQRNLISGGAMDNHVRNVILSAVVGDEPTLRVRDPRVLAKS